MEKSKLDTFETLLVTKYRKDWFEAFQPEGFNSQFEKRLSLEELINSCEEEDFFEDEQISIIFLDYLSDLMIEYYSMGNQDLLNGLWKTFATLKKNGVLPHDEKSEKLYMLLANAPVKRKGYLAGSVACDEDRANVICTALDVFDTSKYASRFIVATDGLTFGQYQTNFEFLKKIAPYCDTEDKLYAIYKKMLEYSDVKSKIQIDPTSCIIDNLRLEKGGVILGASIEQSLDEAILSSEEAIEEDKFLEQVPVYVKKPSMRNFKHYNK